MNAYELADLIGLCGDGGYNQDAATMLRQQQAEIDALKKYIAESNALDKKLHESIQKANEMWGNATKSILKKAKK
jgi:uncharacterized phage infection (PIP) family protein YhgE